MKNIIGFISITVLLFACSKTDIPSTQNSEAVATEKAKGGNGNGGGGGGSALVVTTDEASYILPFGAISGGNVSSSGGGNKVTERGVCFSINPNPTIDDEKIISGSGSGTFTSAISGLLDNTMYYTRAYASKSKNGNTTTTYGDELSFTTTEVIYGTVTDIDGNTYTTIKIGTQEWMMENLKTTTYQDGTPILNVSDDVSWEALGSGAYCNYNNDVAYVVNYGRLYNGYAVEDPRNIAPEGWHVATGDDVRELTQFVRGSNPLNNDTGSRLKEVGLDHWLSPNAYSDNSSGFTALPGGFRRVPSPEFSHLTRQGRWWASNSSGGENLEYFYMSYNHDRFMGSLSGDVYPSIPSDPYHRNNGYSVRCVKD